MIVPRTRLLLWFALIVLPFGTLATMIPETMAFSTAVIALFALSAIVDACIAPGFLNQIGIELAPLVRGTQGRPFGLAVRVRNPSRRSRQLRATLAFPPELRPAEDELTIALPGESEWSAFEWPCSPTKRGRFFVAAAHLEGVSPIGFWSRWRTVTVQSEVRVYPNLARDRKSLAALFLNRGSFGIHAQRQIGRGRDFEKLREYIPGDSFEDVHWKATARRGSPVTKIYQIERTQELYVVLDASRLSARPAGAGPGPSTTLERFIAAALVLGLAAEKQGDLFGLITFSDRVEKFVRASNGQAHYHACRDALYTLEPREVAPDFDELCSFIRLRLRRRALLLFLTSLDDPVSAESFVRNMDLICRQHLLLVNLLRQPGVQPMFSSENVSAVDELYRHVAGHMRWQQLRELDKVLQRRGVRLSVLPGETLAADLVSQYLNVKQRQIL